MSEAFELGGCVIRGAMRVSCVENECEGVVMSAHGAGSGFEWVRWRWGRNGRWRSSIRRRRGSSQNGISGDGGRGGVGGDELTAPLL